MYSLLRPLLFALPAETSHDVSLGLLRAAEQIRILGLVAQRRVHGPVTVMGIDFPNRVGLAAGLDKDGDYFNALGRFGFGFIEIGTVTPRPQPGNPLPRLFRLSPAQALINRMGFNSKGVKHLVEQVQRRNYDGVLGINLGKNMTTPVEEAAQDYLSGMREVYAHADYITVNISSPNTPGLRDLQFGSQLLALLTELKQAQAELAQTHARYVPLAVKIAPDLTTAEIQQCAEAFVQAEVDGVIATNTTLARNGVGGMQHAEETGGLSGAPLCASSTEVIRILSAALPPKLPVIGVGGIFSPNDALEKIEAGASLVQLYTGFIYRGPTLVREVAEAIAQD